MKTEIISGEKHRSIPSLDGLRALSVFAVVLGHTQSEVLDRIPFNSIFRNGGQGVAVFFVISGFLITHLLQKELKREGKIRLRQFYLRRTFRIFPPFYVFLAAVAVVGIFVDMGVTWKHLLAAATYTWNYVPADGSWTLGHSWSLSLEEQFYLLWPACMTFFTKRTNLRIAIGVVALSPISRFVTYYAWPTLRANLTMMLHTRLDTIMMGCLLALLIETEIWPKVKVLISKPLVASIGILFLVGVDGVLEQRWEGKYMLTVGMSLENFAIAAILLYVVFRHDSLLGKFLNLKMLRHLGMISYSLYLWQQLFTGPYTVAFPVNIVLIIGCAELSYFLVEKPSFRLRDSIQRRLLPLWYPPEAVVSASVRSR